MVIVFSYAISVTLEWALYLTTITSMDWSLEDDYVPGRPTVCRESNREYKWTIRQRWAGRLVHEAQGCGFTLAGCLRKAPTCILPFALALPMVICPKPNDSLSSSGTCQIAHVVSYFAYRVFKTPGLTDEGRPRAMGNRHAAERRPASLRRTFNIETKLRLAALAWHRKRPDKSQSQ